MLTLPAPIQAIAFLCKPLPASDNTRKPARGNAGINASRLFMSVLLVSDKNIQYSVFNLSIVVENAVVNIQTTYIIRTFICTFSHLHIFTFINLSIPSAAPHPKFCADDKPAEPAPIQSKPLPQP